MNIELRSFVGISLFLSSSGILVIPEVIYVTIKFALHVSERRLWSWLSTLTALKDLFMLILWN